MKVVQFIDTAGVGGAERMVVELSRALRDQGVLVEVWHFDNPWLADQLSESGIAHIALERERDYRSAYRLPKFWASARRLLVMRKAQVMHTHLLGACFAWAVPARLAGVDHVATFHDVYSLRNSTRARIMVALAAALGTRLVAVSPEIRGLIDSWQRRASIEFILNGIATPIVESYRRAAIRAQRGVDDSAVVFSTVGRLVPVKRHDLMISVFADDAAPSNARLWIIGSGPLIGQLKAEVGRRHAADRISFLGESNDVSGLLAASDAIVSASDSEGLSMALIEGLAAGLPIVATEVGGNHLIVENSRNGITVPPGSKVELAKAVAGVALGQRRPAMGAESRRLFHDRYEASAMARHYKAVYDGGRDQT